MVADPKFCLPISTTKNHLTQMYQTFLFGQWKGSYYGPKTPAEKSLLEKFLQKTTLRAKHFFRWRPMARRIRDILIPALLNPTYKKDLLKAVSKALDYNLARRVNLGWAQDEMYLSMPLEGMHLSFSAIRTINEYLRIWGILILQILTPQEDRTLGIAQIVRCETWDFEKHNSLDFYEVEIFHPVLCLKAMGINDNNLGICWVDKIACQISAEQIFYRHKHETDRPLWPSIDAITKRYPTALSLAKALSKNTLYEEIKHQFNFLRYFHERSIPNGRELVFLKRIHDHPFLLFLWRKCQSPEHKEELAHIIEEVNAKLTSLAFDTDPMVPLLLIENEVINRSALPRYFPTEWEIIISILVEDIDLLMQGNIVSYIKYVSNLDPRIIRQKAVRALQDIFHEDILQMPFCKVDEEGVLSTHPRTHRLFAKWMKGKTSFWEKMEYLIKK